LNNSFLIKKKKKLIPSPLPLSGYGFVTMGSYAAAVAAVQALNGLQLEDKRISVQFKK
jgi:RNA recognition motif-containing protein